VYRQICTAIPEKSWAADLYIMYISSKVTKSLKSGKEIKSLKNGKVISLLTSVLVLVIRILRMHAFVKVVYYFPEQIKVINSSRLKIWILSQTSEMIFCNCKHLKCSHSNPIQLLDWTQLSNISVPKIILQHARASEQSLEEWSGNAISTRSKTFVCECNIKPHGTQLDAVRKLQSKSA